LSAVVSVYAQAIAGILFIIGFQTRWTALVMAINFFIAYIMVHRGQPYDQATAVLSMFFISLLFLFAGPGKYSLDRRLSDSGTSPGKK